MPAPADNLPILAGIQPTLCELRDKGATLPIACHPLQAGHLHYSALTYPSSGNARHLNSSHSFVPNAQQLISSSNDNNRSAALWADRRWNAERFASTTSLCTFIHNSPSRNGPPRTACWVWLNRLCSSVRCFRSCLHTCVGRGQGSQGSPCNLKFDIFLLNF